MKYFIIDALNLCHRSHNVNFDLKTGSGEYSGMFFGFIRTIFSLKKKYRGYKFEVVWDRRPVHKYKLYPDYKSGRVSLPPVISKQIEDIQKFLKSCNVDQYYTDNQEADDTIATLVNRYKDDVGHIIIYSNDKDLLQLVKDGKVTVFKPKVGNSPEVFYDEEKVKEKFGVSPELLSNYRSFDGDASDNIKGVNRVPRKIIARLVNEYETIENVYKNVHNEKLTDFQRRSIESSQQDVLKNFEIIELNRNLKNINSIKGTINKKGVEDLFKKYEIRSIKLDNLIDIFSSSLNIRYTSPADAIKVESFSLF